MKSISKDLRQDIKHYLLNTIDIDRDDRRKEWAINVEFPSVLLQLIDWKKIPTDLFISHLVERCLNWGTYAPNDQRHPLIEYIKSTENFGGNEHQSQMLDILGRLRDEMSVVKDQPSIKTIQSPTPKNEILEKLIGEPTLMPISFLEQGLKLSQSVALVDTGLWSGTGFLVSSNMLITNNHVVPDLATVKHTVFRFNYQHSIENSIGPICDYKPKLGGVFHTSSDLDFSLIEVENTPGEKWGVIKINPDYTIQHDQRVNIIQHPGGKPKQISFRNNFVEYVDDTFIQYVTHTERGSSGSPVFNDLWELVGIHHAGGDIIEPSTQQKVYRNEGIRLSAIINSLPPELRQHVSS